MSNPVFVKLFSSIRLRSSIGEGGELIASLEGNLHKHHYKEDGFQLLQRGFWVCTYCTVVAEGAVQVFSVIVDEAEDQPDQEECHQGDLHM